MKRTTTAIAVTGVLAAPLILTACSDSTPTNDKDGSSTTSASNGRAGTVTPAETSSWRGNLVIGVGDQQANDKITLPAANQVQAQCTGEGDNLTVDITAPNGWHAVLTHGSQTVTIENPQLNYAAKEFTTSQSSLDHEITSNEKFGTTNQFLRGVTWDVPLPGDVEIQLNERTPPHWVIKSAEKVNLAMHVDCSSQ